MRRLLIGVNIKEQEGRFRISAAAGMEREALSPNTHADPYSKREPILLTSTTITSRKLSKGLSACVQRIVEKLFLQNIFKDADSRTKDVLLITKPRYRHIQVEFPHVAVRKDTLITIARTLDKRRSI